MSAQRLGRQSYVSDISLIDTNVILRYLLADHPELHLRSKAILDAVPRSGDAMPIHTLPDGFSSDSLEK
jgi:hypothetical protein